MFKKNFPKLCLYSEVSTSVIVCFLAFFAHLAQWTTTNYPNFIGQMFEDVFKQNFSRAPVLQIGWTVIYHSAIKEHNVLVHEVGEPMFEYLMNEGFYNGVRMFASMVIVTAIRVVAMRNKLKRMLRAWVQERYQTLITKVDYRVTDDIGRNIVEFIV